MTPAATHRKRSRPSDRATRRRGGERRSPQFAPGKLQELATELGRSPSHLSRYFSGERPSATLDQAIRERYGVSPEKLLKQLAPEPGTWGRTQPTSTAEP